MHRRGITAEEAFDVLRETSQRLNVKLAELATTFAASHSEMDLPGNR
jgi:AmiR/NasT family two-component response regulator